MTVLIGIVSMIFLILVGWMWQSLGNIEKPTKIVCIVVGLAIVYLLTYIIFNFSSMGISYESQDTMKAIRKVFVILFSIINGFIILPFTFKKLDQINNEEIEKDSVIKSIVILAIIIVIIFIFEFIYLGDMQEGILKMRK